MINMNNLFSIFDPSTSSMKMNWLMILGIPTATSIFMNSKWKTLMKKTMMKLMKELFQSMTEKKKSSICFLMTWLLMIILMNLTGMIPFSFTLTAQISLSFSLALTIWFSIFLKDWVKKSKKSMAHLVPMGSPDMLMPILVLIELISSIIRPITLSVRLSANMMAGHLMMSLLSESINLNSFMISFPALLTLTILELAVAAIQSYVFTILITLYMSEN